MGFSKKTTFLKTAQNEKVVVGCNWTSKISQNVEKVPSSWEKKIGFSKKNPWVFFKTAKSNQFDAECNWIGKISQRNQILRFFWKTID